jgi:hypothetical protein
MPIVGKYRGDSLVTFHGSHSDKVAAATRLNRILHNHGFRSVTAQGRLLTTAGIQQIRNIDPLLTYKETSDTNCTELILYRRLEPKRSRRLT